MSANVFTPGPKPHTVRAANGAILIAPEGWILLPPGDAALSRNTRSRMAGGNSSSSSSASSAAASRRIRSSEGYWARSIGPERFHFVRV
jgi:hypothetical protein